MDFPKSWMDYRWITHFGNGDTLLIDGELFAAYVEPFSAIITQSPRAKGVRPFVLSAVVWRQEVPASIVPEPSRPRRG
jgi:hypothetical protein